MTQDDRPFKELGAILAPEIKRLGQKRVKSECKVSQGAVSSWSAGRRRPELSHLKALLSLCPTLDRDQVAKAGKYDLHHVRSLDEEARISRHEEARISPDDIERARNDLVTIERARIEGNPSLAIALSTIVLGWLKNKALPSKLPKDVLRILARALYEQELTYTVNTRASLLWNVTAPIRKQWEELELLSGGDDEIYALRLLSSGRVLYTIGRFDESIEELNIASSLLSDVNLQLSLLRILILDYAHLHEKVSGGYHNEFKKAESKGRRYIERGHADLSQICLFTEGLAHGQALLGLDDAFKTIEKNRENCAQLVTGRQVAHLRLIQHERSYLEVVRLLSPNDKPLQEAIIEKVYPWADQLGYERYALCFIDN